MKERCNRIQSIGHGVHYPVKSSITISSGLKPSDEYPSETITKHSHCFSVTLNIFTFHFHPVLQSKLALESSKHPSCYSILGVREFPTHAVFLAKTSSNAGMLQLKSDNLNTNSNNSSKRLHISINLKYASHFTRVFAPVKENGTHKRSGVSQRHFIKENSL